MIYRPAPRFHRDHKRPAGPELAHRDKLLREGIRVHREKRRPGVWDVRVALAVATRHPFSRSSVNLWSWHLPTSRWRCRVARRKPRRRSAVEPQAFRKPAPTIPSTQKRNLRKNWLNVSVLHANLIRDFYRELVTRVTPGKDSMRMTRNNVVYLGPVLVYAIRSLM